MGFLDGIFENWPSDLIDLVSDTARTFTRTAVAYDPLTGVSTPTNTVFTIKTTPPAPFSKEDVSTGDAVAGDLQVVLARRHLEEVNFPQELGTNETMTMDSNGKKYRVRKIEQFSSGDKVAALRIHLHK